MSQGQGFTFPCNNNLKRSFRIYFVTNIIFQEKHFITMFAPFSANNITDHSSVVHRGRNAGGLTSNFHFLFFIRYTIVEIQKSGIHLVTRNEMEFDFSNS